MSIARRSETCTWQCPWKGTEMCAQKLLCCQALAEHRLTLGVLCGLRFLYQQHGLPPCVVGDTLTWAEPSVDMAEAALA
jgi:hypothetical protein